jgi:two-component system nitrogen regulation sensor histidine kinase GlnL
VIKPPTERNILEHLTTAVLLFDRDLRLVYINPGGEVVLEASARHITGQYAHDLWPEAMEFTASLERSVQNGRPYAEREIKFPLPNQRLITVDSVVTPIGDARLADGLLVEMQQVDRHLRIAREENLLSQYNTTRTLLRGMAHEIKNPLGGLRGAAQLLECELNDPALKEYTQIIIDEADRLQNLLNRMLGPNTLPQKRNINVHEVLERVRTLLQREAGARIVINRDYDPSIPDLYADPEQLIQAVLNIGRNALQAMEGNGQIVLQTRSQRQVTLGQRNYRLVALINVIDDGPGIAPEMVESVFYPMITGRADGTGLGLPIAQSIVNQHGGLIECTSRPGETIFTIILPIEAFHE